MKKNRGRLVIILATILIAFSTIAFIVPFKKNEVFWISYVFSIIAIVAQIYVLKIAFQGAESVKSKFYGFPIAQIGIAYMCIQLALSLVFISFSKFVPIEIVVIIEVFLFAVAVIGFIGTDVMRDEIEQLDKEIESTTSCIVTLRSIVYSLSTQCNNLEEKEALSKLFDELRYSDPVSNKALEIIESELEENVAVLQKMFSNEKKEQVVITCKKISAILAERNRLCKLNKK